MKRKQIIFIFPIIIVILLASCINPFLPIYEMTDEDGVSVIIDGVRYKQLPPLKWQQNPSLGEVIGYAGSWDIRISVAARDTDRNYIYLQYAGTDDYNYTLYRTDKDIPDVSVESVDGILWGEYSIDKNSNIGDNYSNTVEDRGVIRELFSFINNGEKFEDTYPIKSDSKTYFISINLLCSDLPAASYTLDVRLNNDKMVCGNYVDKYVEIPMELLEKLAGKKIDISQLTED